MTDLERAIRQTMIDHDPPNVVVPTLDVTSVARPAKRSWALPAIAAGCAALLLGGIGSLLSSGPSHHVAGGVAAPSRSSPPSVSYLAPHVNSSAPLPASTVVSVAPTPADTVPSTPPGEISRADIADVAAQLISPTNGWLLNCGSTEFYVVSGAGNGDGSGSVWFAIVRPDGSFQEQPYLFRAPGRSALTIVNASCAVVDLRDEAGNHLSFHPLAPAVPS